MEDAKILDHLVSPPATPESIEEFSVTELEERLEFCQWMNYQCRLG